MKLLVEIDEETYKDIKKGKVYSSLHDVPQESVLAIANGIPISDNATNGDVIRTLFEPNLVRIMDDFVSEEYEIDEVWWNAPYQKGGTSENTI